MERQALNVFRMRLLGAEVRPAISGSRTLKDAINEAMRDWVATVETSHYLLGSVMGPHPYPWMVRELHRVIGDEAREQCRELLGRDPDVVTACVGGGSNAIGLFSGFAELPDVELVGRGAGGRRRGRRTACPASCTARSRTCSRTSTGRWSRRSRSRPASTTRASAPSTPTSPRPGGPATRRSPTPRCSTRSACWPAPRGSSPPSSRPTRSAWVLRARDELAGQRRDPQPVRPRRQGRRPGRGDPRWLSVEPRLEAHLRDARATAGASCSSRTSPAGSGDDWTEVVRAFAAAGADAIEVGIPFSDPVMDGPTIQEASEVALDQGANLGAILTALRDVDAGVPLVVMTYVNLVFHAGYERFAAEAVAAGVAGVILPDLPMEEVGEWEPPRRRRRARHRAARLAAHARRPAGACSASGRRASSTA